MDDGYLPGAAVLSKSLKDAGTGKKLAVLIDQDNLSISTVTALQVRNREEASNPRSRLICYQGSL